MLFVKLRLAFDTVQTKLPILSFSMTLTFNFPISPCMELIYQKKAAANTNYENEAGTRFVSHFYDTGFMKKILIKKHVSYNLYQNR